MGQEPQWFVLGILIIMITIHYSSVKFRPVQACWPSKSEMVWGMKQAVLFAYKARAAPAMAPIAANDIMPVAEESLLPATVNS